jgi:hypothetical protein
MTVYIKSARRPLFNDWRAGETGRGESQRAASRSLAESKFEQKHPGTKVPLQKETSAQH